MRYPHEELKTHPSDQRTHQASLNICFSCGRTVACTFLRTSFFTTGSIRKFGGQSSAAVAFFWVRMSMIVSWTVFAAAFATSCNGGLNFVLNGKELRGTICIDRTKEDRILDIGLEKSSEHLLYSDSTRKSVLLWWS